MNPNEKLAPVVCEVSVSWPQEEAFRRFVTDFSNWWPRKTHSIGGPRIRRVVFEAKVGGRIYEEHQDGRRFQWGKVLALDPPRSVCFSFHPSKPERSAQTIDLVFHPEGTGTRLELTASNWENWGRGAGRARRGYRIGWRVVLNLWAGRITPPMRVINAIGKVVLAGQLIWYGGRTGLINSAEGEVERA